MEEIRKFVDEMITWAGVTGDFVPMLRHILLTITAILLAMLSDFLCRKILVPLISKITDKTVIAWDDILLNKKVLTSACHIVPAVVIWSLMPLIYLEYPIFKEILERVTGIYIVVMSVRTALVFIGSFKGLEDSQERRSSAQQYFHTFCGVLRVLMLFVAGCGGDCHPARQKPDDPLCRFGCYLGCPDAGLQGYHHGIGGWCASYQQ